jgi:type II secretory pathway predicted ATPase ExeA
MFETFYGLERTPFPRDIPTDKLFHAPEHQEALARLNYLVRTRGFGMLTGAVGSGKTTTIRALHQSLDPARYRFLYVSRSELAPRSFYRELARQLGLAPAHLGADAKQQAAEALWAAYQQQKQPVVVVDEAHLLSAAMLEEARFLTNFTMDSASPMTVILVGQPELRHRLALKSFEAIRQRLQLRYHLGGLDAGDSAAYIRHHLSVAGASRPIFSDDALALIAQVTQGIPRSLNNLATAALLAGYLEQKAIVDEQSVRRAVADSDDAAG